MGGINHKKWHGLQLFYPRHLFFVNAFCEGFTCTISDKELLWVWVSSWSLVGWSLYQQIVLLQVQNFQAQMMLRIDIALPSGKRKRLEVPESSTVGDFKILVRKSFRQGFLKLITAESHVLTGKIFACGRASWMETSSLLLRFKPI